MSTNVGILGLGTYFPPEVRRNDWWSPEVVARWMEQRRSAPRLPPPSVTSEGARRALRAMAEQSQDPFQSTVERRVLAPDLTVHDMEERASRAALADAGLEPGAIDLLLTCAVVPDFLAVNPACLVHERLGLPNACFSLHCDASSYGFMSQMMLAEAMIRTGRARHALLVQACAPSRLLDARDPLSALFGDLATAVVLGPVSDGRGVEAAVSFTNGRNPRTLIASVPGKAWYEEGRAVLHIDDPRQAQAVFVDSVDELKSSVDAVLARSSHALSDVDFFCIHQGAPWLRRVVQEHVGLTHARSVETYARTGYVFASTLPAALTLAVEQRQLSAGDLVVLAAGGPGTTYGGIVIRWGV